MDKRDFLKIGVIYVAGMALAPSKVHANFTLQNRLKVSHVFKTYWDIEEFISASNLETHYKNHYLLPKAKLNKWIGEKQLSLPLKNLFRNSKNIDKEILENAGEFFNHRLFWKIIAKDNNEKGISDNLLVDLEKSFGSFEGFKKEFILAAKNLEGVNGWIWLIRKNKQLLIVKTTGNENPYFSSLPSDQQGYPLLGLDLWKHAYVNQYKTIDAYCQTFLKTLNWTYVSKRNKLN